MHLIIFLKLKSSLPLICGLLCLWLGKTNTLARIAPDPSSNSAQTTANDLTQFSQETWLIEQGLPQNTVQALVQTADGYLWLGTGEGLARYNGQQFTVFDKQNTPQLKNNFIRDLQETTPGQLWIATPNGLLRLAQGQFTAFTTQDGLPHNSIETLSLDQAGRLWLTTPGGLTTGTPGAWVNYNTSNGLSSNTINVTATTPAGTLAIGTTGGLNLLQNGVITATYTTREGLSDNNIKALWADRDGSLWIATYSGVHRLRDGTLTRQEFKFGTVKQNNISQEVNQSWDGAGVTVMRQTDDGSLWLGTNNGLHRWQAERLTSYTTRTGLFSDRINGLYADRTGRLWISTAGGLNCFAGETLRAWRTPAGLANNNVLALLQDREGSLWLGTETGGLHQLKENKFTTYGTAEGLSSDFIKAVCQDQAGRLWLGTRDAGLNLWENGKFRTFTTRDGLLSDTVQALYPDPSGALWIGTPDGLNRWHNGKFTAYTIADGLSDNFVRSLYADHAGALWIGTRRGLNRWENGAFTTYSTLDGLANDFVGALYQDRAGRLWIGTTGGLSCFENDQFTTYTTRDGLVSDVITALYEDASGALWIGTNGGGMNRLAAGRFTAYTTRQGLFDDTVYRIMEDGAGRLWMSSKKGVFTVNRADLEALAEGRQTSFAAVAYDTADGMRTRECSGGGHPAAWQGADGKLWFATLKGVAMIEPARLKRNTQPPPVTIENVRIDDEMLWPGAVSEVAPGRTRFDFYYAALSFVAPAKVRFKYRLEGFDQDWRDGGANRVASYTNLPPGRYQLRVIAANNDGVWNETGASLAIRLRPYFYQTYWFYALLALTTGLAAWWVYRLRVKRLESQFTAVLAERSRIAREIHDNLAQEIAGVSVQLEVVARLLEVSGAAARTHLDQARLLIRHSLAEARRYVWDLRSQSLEKQDLPAALTEAARRLTANTPITTQVEVSGTFRALPPAVESNLLRIGQEAVNNAAKHGRPTQIVLTLSFTTQAVCLSVRDNGTGFAADAPPPNGSFGLIGMRERAADIGGTLAVHSQPAEGTEIIVTVLLT